MYEPLSVKIGKKPQKKPRGNIISRTINGFLYSGIYTVCVAVWVLLSYAFDLQTVGLTVMIAVACLILIFNKDVLPVLPLFLSFIFLITDYDLLVKPVYLCFYAALVISLIFHFIRFRKKPRLGLLFFPLVFISFALFFGGIFSHFRNTFILGLAPVLTVGPLVLVIYLVFLNGIDPPEYVDVKFYVAFTVLTGGFIAGAELVIAKYMLAYPDFNYAFIPLSGNSNALATVITVGIPTGFYLLYKSGRILPCLALTAFSIFAIYISSSDGCLGIAVFSLPFIFAITYRLSKGVVRRRLVSSVLIIVIILSLIGIYLSTVYAPDYIMEVISKKANETGRLNLYDYAFNLFKQYPIFGVGFGFNDESLYYVSTELLNTFNFHSTIFHTLATMGAFGMIAYGFYYYYRFKILTESRSAFSVFAYFSFTVFITYGLIDPCEFNVIPILSYITVLLLTVEREKYKPLS